MDKVQKLTVSYRGQVVGYLAEMKDGTIAFQYDAAWLADGFSISPLSLPLRPDLFSSTKRTFQGLFGVFWDSLPDGWGELTLQRFLSKIGIRYDHLSALQKLSLVRSDGLGALEYTPSTILTDKKIVKGLDELAAEAAKLWENAASQDDLDELYHAGGSSGGARPKAHLTIDSEDWIIKFPCAIDPAEIGEKEYETNLLAKKCGINVAECRLFPSNKCKGYFGSKRFDRTPNGKAHVISLSSLLETTHRLPNLDYGHLLSVIESVSADRENDLYEAFRRACFNVLYKNRDDHGKNFAFLYDEARRGYVLSPAYDLTSTPEKPEHEMTVNHSGTPTEADLLTLARDFNLSQKKCREILEGIKTTLKSVR